MSTTKSVKKTSKGVTAPKTEPTRNAENSTSTHPNQKKDGHQQLQSEAACAEPSLVNPPDKADQKKKHEAINIVITAELQTAAKEVIARWSGLDMQELGDCGVKNVDVKCKDKAGAQRFLEQLIPVTKAVSPINLIVYPLPDAANIKDERVSIWWECALPSVITPLIRDVAETLLDHLEIEHDAWLVLEAYESAFSEIVRCDVEVSDQADAIFAEGVRSDILETQKLLVKFVKLLGVGDQRGSNQATSSTTQANPNELVKKGLRYDVEVGKLCLPNRRSIQLPERYRRVIAAMMEKEPGQEYYRRSNLSYREVAALFEAGRLAENHPGLSETEIAKRVKGMAKLITSKAKDIAQEFRRQFAKWLNKNRIESNAVLKCDPKHQAYALGDGWDSKKIAIGDSEAGVLNKDTESLCEISDESQCDNYTQDEDDPMMDA